MDFVSRYTAYEPDAFGRVCYTEAENDVWRRLYQRQLPIVQNRACAAFLRGLDILGFSQQEIPQLPDVNNKLKNCTGWMMSPVPALISARDFFELLAQKKFPAAMFIRTLDELDYVKEPDIFHELFGHCPMLTEPVYADFIHRYAQLVLTFAEEDWGLLQRLFWFTVEFGLIKTTDGLRVYGGGILSSISETPYCLEGIGPMRVIFEPIAVLRTPYRIDMKQSIYFVIEDFQQLYALISVHMREWLRKARELGEYPPMFPINVIEEGSPNIHIHAC